MLYVYFILTSCLVPYDNQSQKGCTRLTAANNKVYQLLAHGQWLSPGTPDSSTTKTGRHDTAEAFRKVALNTINKSINQLSNQPTIMTLCYSQACLIDIQTESKVTKDRWSLNTFQLLLRQSFHLLHTFLLLLRQSVHLLYTFLLLLRQSFRSPPQP